MTYFVCKNRQVGPRRATITMPPATSATAGKAPRDCTDLVNSRWRGLYDSIAEATHDHIQLHVQQRKEYLCVSS